MYGKHDILRNEIDIRVTNILNNGIDNEQRKNKPVTVSNSMEIPVDMEKLLSSVEEQFEAESYRDIQNKLLQDQEFSDDEAADDDKEVKDKSYCLENVEEEGLEVSSFNQVVDTDRIEVEHESSMSKDLEYDDTFEIQQMLLGDVSDDEEEDQIEDESESGFDDEDNELSTGEEETEEDAKSCSEGFDEEDNEQNIGNMNKL